MKTDYHTQDDKLIINRTQDVTAILDEVKSKGSQAHNARSDMRHVGSVPFVLVEMWMKESGLRMGSPEFAEYVKKKLLSGDYGKLIVHGY